jgi:hypothetical protein
MPLQCILPWIILLVRRQNNGLILKLPDRRSVWRIFPQIIGNDNGVIVIEREPEAVKSPVMVFAE